MYSKYEEMKTIQSVIANYVQNSKNGYEQAMRDLQQKASQKAPNIEEGKGQVKDFASSLSLMAGYQEDYSRAKGVLLELNKAVMCYEMAYPQGLSEDIVEQRKQEGNRTFFQLRTKNTDYKNIMGSIAYSLFVQHDENLEDLVTLGADAKIEELEEKFKTGKISKEQLILYTNACDLLSQNPDFIEYASNFQETQRTSHHK